MKRYGQVIGIKPECLEEYKKYHASVWPEVLQKIKECHIQNYTIFYKDSYLFGYFEYVGNDFQADMQKMADDPKTQEWWAIMKPMQVPLNPQNQNEWWASTEEVFHVD